MAAEGMRNRKEGTVHEGKSSRELSIIVPTYNEVDNIKPLCERLMAAMKEADLIAEVIIVDDESEGSAETERIVKELQQQYDNLRLQSRKKHQGRGLSSAVLLGFEMARYSAVLCMDADLQHRPEEVAKVAEPVLHGEAEMSIGSRHVAGGGLGFDWSLTRRIISAGGKLLCWGVASTSDPMAGFFCTRKEVLMRGKHKMNPKGFKIALEVQCRCRVHPVKDVPITFDERVAGESKLSAKIYKNYLEQLASLYYDQHGPVIFVMIIQIGLILFVIGWFLHNKTMHAIEYFR